MAKVPMELVKKLREISGAGMMDCKNALEEADGDVDKAYTILREKGIAKAVKRAGRATGQGVVESYLHRTTPDYPPQVGVLVEVDCETDFVAKGEEFRKLTKEIALQIAATNPRWVSREDVPDEVLVEERALYERKAEQDGTPPQAIAKSNIPSHLLNPTSPSTSTTLNPPVGVTEQIFLVDPTLYLVAKNRNIAPPASLSQVLNALLLGPTAAESLAGRPRGGLRGAAT